MSDDTTDTLESTFDIDMMPTDAKIIKLHQEGNYLIGLTDKGIKFNQRIPQGKRLNKIDDKYVLQDVGVN
jgi:hypothetical protein